MTRAETALLAAAAHVYRQRQQGAHDQDKIDAIAWFEEYGSLIRELRLKRDREYVDDQS